ncbi:MAG: hydroxymethylbilane synthase [Solirubrobacterales bacterium]|nr:hydroxymethylbilane synthase [Solirubrobacterales bacterium]
MIRVGTRGSALAIAQATWVGERLGSSYELVTVATAGDWGAPVGDKSRWVSALERALLDGEIDVAVHSAKDVPAEIADGLSLVAIPPRADPRDAICGAPGFGALPAGARVGTSSLRRAAQIRSLREDVEVVEVRGNVDSRLRKLADGECDALVLAVAGLARLGRGEAIDGVLDELVPAAGQGALAVEAGPGFVPVDGLADADATACVLAERELTRALGASCNTAVGAWARVVDGSGELELTAWVGASDGSAWIRDRVRGGASSGLGARVADRLLAAGAAELLA